MAIKAGMQIQGLAALRQSLKELGTEVEEKVTRRAVGRATVFMKDAIIKKALLPDPGPLADKPYRHGNKVYPPGSIAKAVIAVRKTEKVGQELYVIGVKSNKQNGYMGRIASFNEFGTVKMAKQPFMTPGYEETKQPAMQRIVSDLKDGLASATRKANKSRK